MQVAIHDSCGQIDLLSSGILSNRSNFFTNEFPLAVLKH